MRLDAPELKRPPAPHAADHPAAELLRRKGFAVWSPDMPATEAFGDDAPARLLERLAAFDPVRGWFIEQLGRGALPSHRAGQGRPSRAGSKGAAPPCGSR
ncbi:DUF2461 family protein [Devosia sp.]|uniref:DUF2461 family protein n=1 Tax=Devosia sp. TaxID=1871048 RepID=UPI001AC33D82|nr:DUF2461 family protein [Devosia sp.]